MKLHIVMVLALFVPACTAVTALAAPEISRGTLSTADGVKIAYDIYERGSDSVIIVCPGYYNSKKNRWMRRAVDIVSPAYDVIIFDFRGHGQSGGTFTWSAKEHLDVNAVLDLAEEKGYKHIGILAFSLGAAAALNAAAGRDDVESMVLVSCPTRFKMVDFRFWEPAMLSDLIDNIACGWEGKGARAGSILLAKDDPLDTIGLIERTSILFIHGDSDWIVKDRHSRRLYDAARGPKRLEIIKGGLHAERLIQCRGETMRKLILDWFAGTLPAAGGAS